MKTNESMVLWKKNTFFLFPIIFAFFTIVGWQVSESSAQDWVTCIKPVNIPDEIDVLEVNDDPIEKTITNETDDDWFQSYFANEEDDLNPDPTDTNGEDHGINIEEDENVYIADDLSWEVYDRNGNCVARGKSGDRFGPSLEDLTPPPGADPLPSDVYFIRIIWDPEPGDDIEFEEGDGRFTYSLTLNGTGIPKVEGFIKDAFSGERLKDVKAKNNNTGISFLSIKSGYYGFQAEEGENNPLNYNRDGYKPLIINDFEINENDHFRQNIILCSNDVVLTATPTSGDAPLTVTFDLPDVTNPEVSAIYDWDFGDGMSSDGPDPVSNTYSNPGTYTVNVTVSVTLPTSDFVTKEIECTVESSVNVGVGGEGDSSNAEIIGTWNSGLWYWDVAESKFTKMESDPPTGDIAAGDFTGDSIIDVAAIYDSGLWYIDGVSLDWTKVPGSAPDSLTAGDVTGDGRAEIIGAWSSGIWYWDVAESKFTKMESDPPTGDIAAGDFTDDGIADVAAIYDSDLWYIDGASLDWTKVPGSAPDNLTAGDVTGDERAEIIGAWSSGIWYWDVAESKFTKMESDPPTGDIAAGDFTGDGIADVAAIYDSDLWHLDGASLDWTKVPGSAPDSLAAGDVTGQ